MNKAEHQDRFAAIAALPDGDIRLDEAALLVAAEFDDTFSIRAYLRRLDELASRFETVYDDTTTFGVSISSLNARTEPSAKQNWTTLP